MRGFLWVLRKRLWRRGRGRGGHRGRGAVGKPGGGRCRLASPNHLCSKRYKCQISWAIRGKRYFILKSLEEMGNCSMMRTCGVSSPGCFGVWRHRGALRLRRCRHFAGHLLVLLLLLTRTLSLVPPHVGDVAFVVEVEHLNIVVGGGWLATAALVS